MFSKKPATVFVCMIVVACNKVKDLTPPVRLRLFHEAVDLSEIPVVAGAVGYIHKSLVVFGKSVSAIPRHLRNHYP